MSTRFPEIATLAPLRLKMEDPLLTVNQSELMFCPTSLILGSRLISVTIIEPAETSKVALAQTGSPAKSVAFCKVE